MVGKLQLLCVGVQLLLSLCSQSHKGKEVYIVRQTHTIVLSKCQVTSTGSLLPTSAAHRLPCRWRHSSVKRMAVCRHFARFVERMRVFVVLELYLGLVGLGLGLVLELELVLGCPYWSMGMGRMSVLPPTGRMGCRYCIHRLIRPRYVLGEIMTTFVHQSR